MVEDVSTGLPNVRIRPRGSAVWLGVGSNVLFAVLATIYVVVKIADHRPAFFVVVGAILFVPLVLIGLLAPSGELTQTDLTVGAGVFRRRVIPLSRVVDSGMLFALQPRISCWLPYVWLDDGSAVRLPIGVHVGNNPLTAGGRLGDRWSELAATPQGALCIAILDRSPTQPGLPSPLRDEPELPTGGRSREVAHWSAARPASTDPEISAIEPVPGGSHCSDRVQRGALPCEWATAGDRRVPHGMVTGSNSGE